MMMRCGFLSKALLVFLVVQLVGIASGQNSTCDQKETRLSFCLNSDACWGCYIGAVNVAVTENKLCGIIESMLCATDTRCGSCGAGCGSEAEMYYQCILDNDDCEVIVDCADTTCEAELIAVSNCDATLDASCVSCVVGAVDALQDQSSCPDFESTLCAATESCGCQQCADEVESWYSCLVETTCPGVECTANGGGGGDSGGGGSGSGSGSGGGTIAVVLVVVVIVIIGGLGVCYFVRRKKEQKKNDLDRNTKTNDELSEPRSSSTPISQRHDAHSENSPRLPYITEAVPLGQSYIHGRRPISEPRASPYVTAVQSVHTPA